MKPIRSLLDHSSALSGEVSKVGSENGRGDDAEKEGEGGERSNEERAVFRQSKKLVIERSETAHTCGPCLEKEK